MEGFFLVVGWLILFKHYYVVIVNLLILSQMNSLLGRNAGMPF